MMNKSEQLSLFPTNRRKKYRANKFIDILCHLKQEKYYFGINKKNKKHSEIIEQLSLNFLEQVNKNETKERNYTCPHCRDKFLNFLRYFRQEIGREAAKEFRNRYILFIRKGNWKMEVHGKRTTIYCGNPEISYAKLSFCSGHGFSCGYSLSAKEKKDFLNIADKNKEHKKLIDAYYKMRDKKISADKIIPKLSTKFHYQPSMIMKIVHSNK